MKEKACKEAREGNISFNGKEYPCGTSLTMDIIGGKWKAVILWYLLDGTRRFAELRKDIPQITGAHAQHPVAAVGERQCGAPASHNRQAAATGRIFAHRLWRNIGAGNTNHCTLGQPAGRIALQNNIVRI